MNDREFLFGLVDRFITVYGEKPGTDFVTKLYSIAQATPAEQNTPNLHFIPDKVLWHFKPKTNTFDETHPEWNLAVAFHSNKLNSLERSVAKKVLFHIHYGNYDLTKLFKAVTAICKSSSQETKNV